jgi:hypothetical protein
MRSNAENATDERPLDADRPSLPPDSSPSAVGRGRRAWQRIPAHWRFIGGLFVGAKVVLTLVGLMAIHANDRFLLSTPTLDPRFMEADKHAATNHEWLAMWFAWDEDLIKLGIRELETLGLVKPDAVEQGHVVRMPKAYPVYDQYYQRNVEVIREWLEQAVPNVHPVGRNGMHRYNNADHSMFTAMLTVENILDGAGNDIWAVNVEEDYHEEKATAGDHGTGRAAPILPRQRESENRESENSIPVSANSN